MPELHEVEYEVYYRDECVAITCGDNAIEEARHYAMMFTEKDSPFVAYIYMVSKARELVY